MHTTKPDAVTEPQYCDALGDGSYPLRVLASTNARLPESVSADRKTLLQKTLFECIELKTWLPGFGPGPS